MELLSKYSLLAIQEKIKIFNNSTIMGMYYNFLLSICSLSKLFNMQILFSSQRGQAHKYIATTTSWVGVDNPSRLVLYAMLAASPTRSKSCFLLAEKKLDFLFVCCVSYAFNKWGKESSEIYTYIEFMFK